MFSMGLCDDRWYIERNVEVIVSFQEERARGEHNLIVSFQEERSRGENNLSNITKTHERMQLEQKSWYPKCQMTIKGE